MIAHIERCYPNDIEVQLGLEISRVEEGYCVSTYFEGEYSEYCINDFGLHIIEGIFKEHNDKVKN